MGSLSITSFRVETKEEPVKKTDISEFYGEWTIDIQGGSAVWIEVHKDMDYLDADLLRNGGSVLPLTNLYMAGFNY